MHAQFGMLVEAKKFPRILNWMYIYTLCPEKRTHSFPGINLTILGLFLQFLANVIPKIRFT